jgi:hypothetical protein
MNSQNASLPECPANDSTVEILIVHDVIMHISDNALDLDSES